MVTEETGYPKDMLDLDLGLEADLRVDTVKQAEMFAAIRETYNIPRDPNLELRDFPTMADVIQFASDHGPDLQVPPRLRLPQSGGRRRCFPRPHRSRRGRSAPTEDAIREKVLAIVTEKTGYPKDMLDLDLDLEADLGVDTVKQAEMFAAIRETYNIPRDENLKLRDFPTLAHVIRFVSDKRSRPCRRGCAPVGGGSRSIRAGADPCRGPGGRGRLKEHSAGDGGREDRLSQGHAGS